MAELAAPDFAAFFEQLNSNPPFPWQQRLAERVLSSGWPASLDLPTASGKTACIDIAVFAMAARPGNPRRVFFIVDRRVVVDAAYERMQHIAKFLRDARDGVLGEVARRLREMASGGDAAGCFEPMSTYQLRGGIYRDDAWVRSPLQPTLIASTVDQVGSRLLFRGYGVWDKVMPMHAALVANDALLLLDEAHYSQPFARTLQEIQRYRGPGWAARPIQAPFAFVEMTATPVREQSDIFRLAEDDLIHPVLKKRLYAPKPVELSVAKARANDFEKIADDLVSKAVKLAQQPHLRRIAVIVNRVRTARLVYALLVAQERRAHLLIGRMRPVDRQALPTDIDAMLSGKPRSVDAEPVFIVSTQCLEVGADLDFDAIVTECASIDALLQRFGRLDRIGKLSERGDASAGCIVIATPMTDKKYRDPVYAEALSSTWNWLSVPGGTLDFGICGPPGKPTVRERLQSEPESARLRRSPPPSPTLLPTHLDLLVQTSPRPEPDPDVHLFLHGKETGVPDVQVLWRADLDPQDPDSWKEAVAFCPPVSAEAMAVPLPAFRTWWTRNQESPNSSDIEGVDANESPDEDPVRSPVLRWCGDASSTLTEPNEVRPGDTLVLRAAMEGWNELGHIPPGAPIDVAEQARAQLKRPWLLRLHPKLIEHWPETQSRERIKQLIEDPDLDRDTLIQALTDYRRELNGESGWLTTLLGAIPKRLELNSYPQGWILSARAAEADAGMDESSSSSPVTLDRHLKDVEGVAARFASSLLCPVGQAVSPASTACVSGTLPERDSLLQAARLHDIGKSDPRFQALLHGGDPFAAQFAPRLLAKGSQARQSTAVRRLQWRRSGLPDNFRHELISILLARQDSQIESDDLALHLIASHHGRCRPFPPVVEDPGREFAFNGYRVTSDTHTQHAAHRLDSGIADRFWHLTRTYGWWGLAYLEAILRLADWEASKQESEERDREVTK